MPETALKEWHDFYVLIGTAAATLVGLTFVAASIGAGVVTSEHETGLRTFTTPTVVHFSAILFGCLLVLTPIESRTVFGTLLLIEAAGGLVYAGAVWLRMYRHGFIAMVDVTDRLWYALTPVLAYAVVAGAAIAYIIGWRVSLAAIACGFGILLFAAIRNAWDMALWIVMRPRERG